MNYTKKSFVVATPGTREYADNWERTFRNPGELPEAHLNDCSIFYAGSKCNCKGPPTVTLDGVEHEGLRRSPSMALSTSSKTSKSSQ